ncbi:MAG: hypothetical protein RLP09_04410 [Sandaracinaceae bacterium]|nr:hypothetical protein [Myxococcales bacterium]
MKPSEARRLAGEHDANALQAAAEALGDERAPAIVVHGKDEGEMLTHVLLAMRIRARVDAGEEPKDAYRAVMGEVRGVLSNG